MICSWGGRLKGACGVAAASAARPLTQPPSRRTQAATRWDGRSPEYGQNTKRPDLWSVAGTGKTHFVEALAHKVIDDGMRVSWFTLSP